MVSSGASFQAVMSGLISHVEEDVAVKIRCIR